MILFSASWCSYCKKPKEMIENNNLDVIIIDIDNPEHKDLIKQWGVKGIPALVDGDNLITGSENIIKILGECSGV